ncbi:hypothetical protein DPMN_187334 [Dreissena polymorpha]|uniref:Uncharacterized protein n=1 Tax=Dreissena polymorpha TaxID=45954 RepID=A0A9D4IA91_DREPO|nr:hypothetical protein DPMN_187334 [Dreissena polymorpha]
MNVEPALTSTFGTSFEYRAVTNDAPALISTFGTSPKYRAGTNIEPALTSTFGTRREYKTGANVEPALTSTFGTIPEYRAGANIEPALTSTLGTNKVDRNGSGDIVVERARYNNVGIGTEGVLSKRLDISIKVCTAAKIVQLSSKERIGFPKSNTLVEVQEAHSNGGRNVSWFIVESPGTNPDCKEERI